MMLRSAPGALSTQAEAADTTQLEDFTLGANITEKDLSVNEGQGKPVVRTPAEAELTFTGAVDVILQALGRHVAPPTGGKRWPVSLRAGRSRAHGLWLVSQTNSESTAHVQQVSFLTSMSQMTQTGGQNLQVQVAVLV